MEFKGSSPSSMKIDELLRLNGKRKQSDVFSFFRTVYVEAFIFLHIFKHRMLCVSLF